jgi:hypothetical protein
VMAHVKQTTAPRDGAPVEGMQYATVEKALTAMVTVTAGRLEAQDRCTRAKLARTTVALTKALRATTSVPQL